MRLRFIGHVTPFLALFLAWPLFMLATHLLPASIVAHARYVVIAIVVTCCVYLVFFDKCFDTRMILSQRGYMLSFISVYRIVSRHGQKLVRAMPSKDQLLLIPGLSLTRDLDMVNEYLNRTSH